ncbi:hypothetical protein [Streptomyces sp. ALI-76-A]|uniref:hypothetical protein n=1 Tax=Streptomyces sp. ALI-76-A TaxID=3025736 RepID=UPI00256F2A16|nr:hypothetical protein [Streptomyces sp. ALI-76-A]MDL5202269.1 hypothetical protein [Streptomyces sp. ALI-76-A]
MSLAAWALAVALFGAVGTVANMVASWSTYRRVRPRADVDTKWFIFGAHEWEDPMGVFLVDITNTSQSEIKVRHLSLRVDLAPQELVPIDDGPCYTALDVIKGDTEEAIPAMGEMNLQVEPTGMMQELIPYIRRVRVEVTLTKKSKMVSKWMSKKDQVWFEFNDLMEYVKAHAAHLGYESPLHRQLSFDELEDVE